MAEGVALLEALAQASRFLDEAGLLHRAVDDGAQRLGVERLEEVVLGALLHRLDGAGDGAERGHDDEHGTGRRCACLLHERDSVQARHLEVREDDVGGELLEFSKSLETIRCRFGGVPVLAQYLAQRGAGVRLVVDDEDPASLSQPVSAHEMAHEGYSVVEKRRELMLEG